MARSKKAKKHDPDEGLSQRGSNILTAIVLAPNLVAMLVLIVVAINYFANLV